jgi:hypothetical protein
MKMFGNIRRKNSDVENQHKLTCRSNRMIYLASIIAIALISSFLIQITSIPPAEALTRYYNCLARVVNKNATLSIANVDACYNQVFKGALDYYGIKQFHSTDDKNTSSEGDSTKQSDGPIKKIDNTNPKIVSEKVQGNSNLNDVFG